MEQYLIGRGIGDDGVVARIGGSKIPNWRASKRAGNRTGRNQNIISGDVQWERVAGCLEMNCVIVRNQRAGYDELVIRTSRRSAEVEIDRGTGVQLQVAKGVGAESAVRAAVDAGARVGRNGAINRAPTKQFLPREQSVTDGGDIEGGTRRNGGTCP